MDGKILNFGIKTVIIFLSVLIFFLNEPVAAYTAFRKFQCEYKQCERYCVNEYRNTYKIITAECAKEDNFCQCYSDFDRPENYRPTPRGRCYVRKCQNFCDFQFPPIRRRSAATQSECMKDNFCQCYFVNPSGRHQNLNRRQKGDKEDENWNCMQISYVIVISMHLSLCQIYSAYLNLLFVSVHSVDVYFHPFLFFSSSQWWGTYLCNLLCYLEINKWNFIRLTMLCPGETRWIKLKNLSFSIQFVPHKWNLIYFGTFIYSYVSI